MKMCLLILQIGKTKVKKENFFEASKINKDGIGILIKDYNNKISIQKFKKTKEAYEFYDKLEDGDYKEIVIHFRFGTSGGINYEMMHPFSLGDNNGGWLFHNGVLSQDEVPIINGISDTASLAQYIRSSDLSEEQLHSNVVRLLFRNLTSISNKFLVISPNKFVLYGETFGHWNDEKNIWYSNSGYKIYNYSNKEIIEDEYYSRWNI